MQVPSVNVPQMMNRSTDMVQATRRAFSSCYGSHQKTSPAPIPETASLP
jgi:hypothetical protein